MTIWIQIHFVRGFTYSLKTLGPIFTFPEFLLLQAPVVQEWKSLHAALLDALLLEKKNNTNLQSLHKLAADNKDPDVSVLLFGL